MKTPRNAPRISNARCALAITALWTATAAGQAITLVQPGVVTGTFDGPQGLGSDPEIVRTSDQHHIFYSSSSMPSTLPSQYTQPNIAGGGQTGGGLVDATARAAECAMKIGVSYTNSGAHPLIEVRKMTRTFLAPGYTVVGSMSTPNTFQSAIFDIGGSGTIPFSMYQSGTSGFLTVGITAVSGTVSGNTITTPGRYRVSASTTSAFMNSTTTPGEVTKDSTVRIVLGLAPCYANCDGSVTTPLLNANDFQCFLNLFAAGNSAANCDNSTIAPVLNANDFQCFLGKFAAGCS